MRNLFYKVFFVLIVAASLVILMALLRPGDLNVTVTEPEHIEEKTAEKIIAVPEKKSETVEVTTAPQPVEKQTKSDPVSEKKSVEVAEKVVIKPITEKKIAVTEKKTETVKSPDATVKKIIPVEKKPAEEKTVKKEIPPAEKIVETVKYKVGWLEEFEPDGKLNGVKYVDNWKRDGGIIFTPKTKFYLKYDDDARSDSVLVIESKKSSAVFACDLSNVIDLNKTPILRWRWRVKKLPPRGDGRHKKRDDQAVGIYVGSGTAFNQKAISYRWETETPIGHWGKTVYSNVMNVWFYCLRNKESGLNVWYEESRNVRQDFLNQYGYVPEKIALVICGNSQNSKGDALAEIDYIGFYKEVKQKGKR